MARSTSTIVALLTLLFVALAGSPACADEANGLVAPWLSSVDPGVAASMMGATPAVTQDESAGPSADGQRMRTWEMPAITVQGEAAPALAEEELIGTYRQPRWTATRRFPSTRVYVIPEGKVEVEGWARGTFNRDGKDEWRFLQELEIGLPHRFQLDLYLRQDHQTDDNKTLWGGQFELRWALADWGEIWGNPTLYFEYLTLDERPDKVEPKLLLGGQIAEGWHWGANIVSEIELGGAREHEYQFTGAISHTVIDSVLSIGAEALVTFADEKGHRGEFSPSILLGPSFQWRPTPPMTVNVSPLMGLNHNSPVVQLWVNLGWEF